MKIEIDTNELPKSYFKNGGADSDLFQKIKSLEKYLEKHKDLWIVNKAVLRYRIENETRVSDGSLHWFSKPFKYKTAIELAKKWADSSYVVQLKEHDGDSKDLEFRNYSIFDKDRMSVEIYNLYDYNMSVNSRHEVRKERLLESKYWDYEGDAEFYGRTQLVQK